MDTIALIAGMAALIGIYVMGIMTIASNIRDVEAVLLRLLEIEGRMKARDASAATSPAQNDASR